MRSDESGTLEQVERFGFLTGTRSRSPLWTGVRMGEISFSLKAPCLLGETPLSFLKRFANSFFLRRVSSPPPFFFQLPNRHRFRRRLHQNLGYPETRLCLHHPSPQVPRLRSQVFPRRIRTSLLPLPLSLFFHSHGHRRLQNSRPSLRSYFLLFVSGQSLRLVLGLVRLRLDGQDLVGGRLVVGEEHRDGFGQGDGCGCGWEGRIPG